MAKKKRGRSRRQYSDELKSEAVQMLLDGHSAVPWCLVLGSAEPALFIVGRRIWSRRVAQRRRRWRRECRSWKRNCVAWSKSETY